MKMSSAFSHVFLLIVSILLVPVVSASRTWHINASGTGDAPTIQAAIDSTSPGDTILVAAGTYTWSNQNTNSDYGMLHFIRDKTDIFLHSESGAAATILNAQKQGRVMFLAGFNNLEIIGFTITGGEAPALGYFVGGGIGAHLSYDLVKDCIFRGNRAQFGAGLWCGGVSSMRIENCEFYNNTATSHGGAMYFVNSYNAPTIKECLVRNNFAGSHGGAIYANNNNLNIENSVIAHNDAVNDGGAIRLQSVTTASIVGCTIAENEATTGGAIALVASNLSVERSVIAYALGGGAFSADGTSSLTVGCSDVYGNGGGNALPPGSVDNGGNFQLNPTFCAPLGTLVYTLDSGSPCAPGNHPNGGACGLIGAGQVGCTVPTETYSWGSIKARYR